MSLEDVALPNDRSRPPSLPKPRKLGFVSHDLALCFPWDQAAIGIVTTARGCRSWQFACRVRDRGMGSARGLKGRDANKIIAIVPSFDREI